MTNGYVTSSPLPGHMIWRGIFGGKKKPLSFSLELTVRCSNNCTHCYNNLPAGDPGAKAGELSLKELKPIINEAVSMGAIWCQITGGEPLLRRDFADIYLYLKKKGLLVSVFTNATLINEEHIRLFKQYPPRDLEVTVYGVTSETYENVSRVPGSFERFMRGLELLLRNDIKVRLKAMALRSNVHELRRITDFCSARTKDYFRFDPFLHLRFDRDKQRNEDIRSERLTPEEIVLLEKSDPQRFKVLEENCGQLILETVPHDSCGHLFRCGAGKTGFYVGYDGMFHLCSALRHADCIYDLRKGNLREAWERFVPKVRGMTTPNQKYQRTCGQCSIVNLCLWCPAHADLETGHMDQFVNYFCAVAHKRKEMLHVEIS